MTASSHLRKALEAVDGGTFTAGRLQQLRQSADEFPTTLWPEDVTLITLLVNAGGAIADLIEEAVDQHDHERLHTVESGDCGCTFCLAYRSYVAALKG